MGSQDEESQSIADAFDCKDSATSVTITDQAIVVGCVDGVLRTYDLRKDCFMQFSWILS